MTRLFYFILFNSYVIYNSIIYLCCSDLIEIWYKSIMKRTDIINKTYKHFYNERGT